MHKINKIIIHCSDSTFGDVPTIDDWHKERGWSGIGYHYVITNGFRRKKDLYDAGFDGVMQKGRNNELEGAHCKGHNHDSIGICLIGEYHFTSKQLNSLKVLLISLMRKYGLSHYDVYAHYQFNPHKTCPNMDIEIIKAIVS